MRVSLVGIQKHLAQTAMYVFRINALALLHEPARHMQMTC